VMKTTLPKEKTQSASAGPEVKGNRGSKIVQGSKLAKDDRVDNKYRNLRLALLFMYGLVAEATDEKEG